VACSTSTRCWPGSDVPDQPDRDQDDPAASWPPEHRADLLPRPARRRLDHRHHPPRGDAASRPLSQLNLDRWAGRGRLRLRPNFSGSCCSARRRSKSPLARSRGDCRYIGPITLSPAQLLLSFSRRGFPSGARRRTRFPRDRPGRSRTQRRSARCRPGAPRAR